MKLILGKYSYYQFAKRCKDLYGSFPWQCSPVVVEPGKPYPMTNMRPGPIDKFVSSLSMCPDFIVSGHGDAPDAAVDMLLTKIIEQDPENWKSDV